MPTPAVYAADGQGFPTQYAAKIENIYSNQNGDSITVNCNAGDALVAIAIGLKSNDPFDLLHGTSPYPVAGGGGNTVSSAFTAGLNDFMPSAPTISDAQVNSASVTSVSISGNVLTALVSNNYVAGDVITLSGFATPGGASFLNGQSVTVATASGSQFTAPFTHANYGVTATITNVALTSNVATITAANSFAAGSKVALSGLTTATFLNGQTVTVIATGLSGTQFEFNFTHADYPSAADTGSATDADTGSASNTSGNSYALITNLNLADSDYTVSSTPPVAPNPFPSSQWSLDGYYPSMYIWAATNVAAGSTKVTLNSMYTSAGAPEWQLGRPIFEGGVTLLVIRFSGVLASAAQDGHAIGTSAAAQAAPATFATTQGMELLLSVGLMKSGNVFSTGHVNQGAVDTADAVTLIASGKLVGSEAHYAVEMATPASGSGTTKLYFSNPLGYEMLVGTIALKHS